MFVYQLNDLVFKYAEKTILNIDKLEIADSKVTALVGANGCGKSTLLNLLAFLASPGNGRMSFQGQRVNPKKLRPLRKRIGFLPQKPYMLKGSVEDNLKLPLKLHHINKSLWADKISEALAQLDIAHLRLQSANTLSGGELQKAALARLLILQPDVLLLDEPFSYLDPISALKLEDFIRNFCSRTRSSLIFSTHNRLKATELADDVVSLIDGDAVRASLINCFYGRLQNNVFNTGNITIQVAAGKDEFSHVAIEPDDIYLTRETNAVNFDHHFQGRINSIIEQGGKAVITVLAGEKFQVSLSFKALHDLSLTLGTTVWVNFNSEAVITF